MAEAEAAESVNGGEAAELVSREDEDGTFLEDTDGSEGGSGLGGLEGRSGSGRTCHVSICVNHVNNVFGGQDLVVVKPDDCVNHYSVAGMQMGRIEWDVKDCMKSRQDYTIAVKKKKKKR